MSEANQPSENQPIDLESLELKLPDESADWKDIGLWAGVLVLLTLIAYWPATTGSFIWHDDRAAENNTLLAPTGLTHIWLDRWQQPDQFKQPVYQPIADSAFWAEYRLGGHNDQGIPTATAYHIASLIFHAGAAVLLWLALRELLVPGSWLIAAIFALHPIHSEDISWISQQGIALSGLFFAGSIYLYLMFLKCLEKAGNDPAETWGFYAGSAVCGVLALLSHPSALVLPMVVLLLLWWRNRLKSRDVLLQVPLVMIGAVLWFKNVDLHSGADQWSWIARAETIGHALEFSLIKLIIPFGQSIIYSGSPSVPGLIFFLIGIIALVLAYPVSRGFFASLAVFFIIVCFSVNWFDASRFSAVTDSSAYLAMVPLTALAIAVFSRIKLPGPHPQSVVAVSTVVLLVLGGLTWTRTHVFESPLSLWRDVLNKDPASNFAETSLAEQLRLQAIDDTAQKNTDAVKPELAEAIAHAQAVLQRDPNNSSAQRTWADVLVAQGDNAAAASHFEGAIQFDPTNAGLRNEYAETLVKVGRYQPAITQLNESLKWDVNSSTTHRLLGEAYEGIGNTDRAIKELQLAVNIDQKDYIAWEKLAQLQVKTGKLDEALTSYERVAADAVHSHRADLWVAIAKIKDQQGVYMPAVQYFQAALSESPDDTDIAAMLKQEQEKLNRAAATRPAATQTFK